MGEVVEKREKFAGTNFGIQRPIALYGSTFTFGVCSPNAQLSDMFMLAVAVTQAAAAAELEYKL